MQSVILFRPLQNRFSHTVPAKEISAIKATEASLFLHTCGRLKYANLALLYTFVQSLHELQLYVVRLVGVMELFAALHLLLLCRLYRQLLYACTDVCRHGERTNSATVTTSLL